MKPKWNDAPSWANHLTENKEGVWFWWEYKPYINKENLCTVHDGMCCVAVTQNSTYWKNSLETK